mgnify:CR=1 FL=1
MVAWVRIAARYTSEGDTGEGLRIIARPNRTLTLRGMTALFARITVVVLTFKVLDLSWQAHGRYCRLSAWRCLW